MLIIQSLNKLNNSFLTVCSILFLLGAFCSQSLNAQQSLRFQERYPVFHDGKDLYEKEKFSAAQHVFEKFLESTEDSHSEVRIEAEFYRALCAIQLYHDNAAALLQNFIMRYPESVFINEAYFQLAKYQFRKRNYEKVLEGLKGLEPLDLTKEQGAEYFFKKGYAEFQLEKYDEATASFYEIKDSDNPYVSAARYYYAHLAYQAAKYQTALIDFKKVEKDPQFGPLVPYYITQLYYLQGDFDMLLAYAPAVLDSAPPKREVEIKKLIGSAYYETGQFDKAIPYLKDYLDRKQGDEEDYYELGLSYVKTKNYLQAIKSLEKAIGTNDTLNQSAYYYIGESAVKVDQKSAAKRAFNSAYRIGIDEEITEESLFNYAKLSYELSYHPYDDAILAFEAYIDAYPNSTKLEDAYEYMLGVYYTTKNYEAALQSLERIDSKDIQLLQAKQRLAYYRGVELFNEKNFLDAIDKFQMAINHNYDPKLRASSVFWMAESFSQVGDYDNAINYYTDFLASSGARSLAYYKRAYYNLGYVFYENRAYKSAVFWLSEYVDKADPKNKGLINDAQLRLGDSYFIQKKYAKAIQAYDRAAAIGVKDKDYALLQSAISSGVEGNYDAKAKKLKTLVNNVKTSVYTDDALFELGKTYLLLKQNQEAIAYYNQLINDFPTSNYLAESNLKIGLIYYNQEEDDLALNSFNTVVKDFSNSVHAQAALEKIRKIYIDKGDAEAFENYIKGVSFANISKAKLDSTAYIIAENHYLQGNCEKATRDFTNYLKRYPNGIFSLNAHFYRANCETSLGFDQEAASDYRKVLAMPANKFNEKALLELARIYYSMDLLDSAAKTYEHLLKTAERTTNYNLAQKALMEIYFEQKNYHSASQYAQALLNGSLLPLELWQKAQLTLAKTHFEKSEYDSANVYLDTLSKLKTEYGAEAKYLLARKYYLQGDYAKSDTLIYRLVDQVPSYPFWIAKGFILLADNFIAKDDLYNARITFQSVIDNADDEKLVSIAKEKLEILNQASQTEEKEEKPIEVDLGKGQAPEMEQDSANQSNNKTEEELNNEK